MSFLISLLKWFNALELFNGTLTNNLIISNFNENMRINKKNMKHRNVAFEMLFHVQNEQFIYGASLHANTFLLNYAIISKKNLFKKSVTI